MHKLFFIDERTNKKCDLPRQDLAGGDIGCAVKARVINRHHRRLKMNAKQLIAAMAVFAAAGSVFAAGQTEYVDFSNFQSTRNRADVRAELEQAYRDGQLGKNTEYVDQTHVVSSKSRAEVRDEAILAAKSGRIDNLYFGS